MVYYFFGCLCLERNNFWPFGEVVNYHANISVAIGSWLEADHKISGYLAPGFVRHNHTVEVGIGFLLVYFLCNLAFVAGIYEVGHILGDPRPVVPLCNPLTCFILPEMPSCWLHLFGLSNPKVDALHNLQLQGLVSDNFNWILWL